MRFDRFDYTVWVVCLVLSLAIAGLVWIGGHKPATVRELYILYRSDTDNNLYRRALSGGEAQMLTDRGDFLFDFAPAPDGNQIAFSVVNEQKGIDIWTMNRDGSGPKQLLNCGLDRCSTPIWSPDRTQLAYSRIEAGLGPGEPYSPARIWLANPISGETYRLFQNPEKIGYGPTWSPDGRKLAYSDGTNSRMVIVNLETGSEFFIPNQSGRVGSWSPDSRYMVYSDFLITDTGPNEVVNRVDFETEDILHLMGYRPNESSFSTPIWSPTGEWIATNARTSRTEVHFELFLKATEGDYGFVVANDPDFAYSNYSFDPSGRYFLFQRIPLGVAYAEAEILVIDLETMDTLMLIPSGSFPAWLP